MVERSESSVELNDAFAQQMSLCDLLERMADALPTAVDRQQCLMLARLVGPLLNGAHRTEEKHLFPRLLVAHADGAELVERLRLEHIEDACFAEEVQEELMLLGQGRPVLAPEATGYMLRGFFECIRRRVRHERELLARLELRTSCC